MPENGLSEEVPYINRELSLLEFQRRVLEEAEDEDNPLLERVKFLAIFGSNMDEFFMVRVSGIRKQVEAEVPEVSVMADAAGSSLAPSARCRLSCITDAHDCLDRKLLPELERAGIHVIDYWQAEQEPQEKVDDYFQQVVYPVLTPLALDPGHPFPHISNLSLNLAIVIRDPARQGKVCPPEGARHAAAACPVQTFIGRTRGDGTVPHRHYFVWLEQLITANLATLFPGMEVVAAHPFRIIRDADMEIQEIEADDLLETMQQSIRRTAVRLRGAGGDV